MAKSRVSSFNPSSLIIVGVVITAFWSYLYSGQLAKARTAGWDVPVSGRVVDVDYTSHAKRGWVQVVFEYTAPDGRPGRGILQPRGLVTSGREAISYSHTYKVGTKVNGFANPDNPTEAVILRYTRQTPTWWYGVPALGVLLVLGGILKLVLRRKQGGEGRSRVRVRVVRRTDTLHP